MDVTGEFDDSGRKRIRRPQIALMDTDYFGQRIKTDDTDCTNYSLEREFDVTREFDNSGLTKGRPQIAQMDTDFLDNGLRRMTRIALIIL